MQPEQACRETKKYWQQSLLSTYSDITSISTQIIDDEYCITISKIKDLEELPQRLPMVNNGVIVSDQFVNVKSKIVNDYPKAIASDTLSYEDGVATVEYYYNQLLETYQDIVRIAPQIDHNDSVIIHVTKLKNLDELPKRLPLIRNRTIIPNKFVPVEATIDDYPSAN